VSYFYGPVQQALFALFAAVGLLLLIARQRLRADADACLRDGTRMRAARPGRHARTARPAVGARDGAAVRGGRPAGLAAGQVLTRAIVSLAGDVPRLSSVAINGRSRCSHPRDGGDGAPLRLGRQPRVNDESRRIAEHGTLDGRARRSARSVLVILQVAFSLALTVTAALVLRSFVNLRHIDLGFAARSSVEHARGAARRGKRQGRLGR
jgi:hypothetical protein